MFNISKENVDMFSEISYRNPQCVSSEDFFEDMSRIKYVKRLFNKYNRGGEIKTRLILNHIIAFYNVFENRDATRILFFKMEEEYWPLLKTFLLYLSYMPEIVHGVNGRNVMSDEITIDNFILTQLESI
ncbi:MAG: hypothetical protein CMD28_04830 [Flavobacteriales bacterium]|nr:hypothetical protein [Flavobacteriales bacterium]|tara:strand:+ start:897 stop:1283 length:387 start_codon:yes stop_codon:yes gene_type:complete